MKKKFLLLLIMMFVFIDAGIMRAESNDVYTFYMSKIPERTPDLDPEGNRKPGKPMLCEISRQNGLQIPLQKTQILQYELLDAETGEPVWLCPDDGAFVEYVFSISGDFIIRINAQDGIYQGNISL